MIQSLRTIRRLTGHYLRVLKLVWEANPKYALISLLLTLGSASVAPMQVWLSKTVIDRVVATVQASGESVPADWRHALAPMLLLLAAWAATAMLSTIESSFTVLPLMPYAVADHAMFLLHRKASSLDLAFYENPHYYTTTAWISRRRRSGTPTISPILRRKRSDRWSRCWLCWGCCLGSIWGRFHFWW